jgi:methionyl-tRNA formyltransferase
MRLVFAGTPRAAVESLEALAASRHEVVAVLTRPDARAGRGRRQARSEVAAWADDRSLPVLQPLHPKDPAFLAELRDLAPDCVPVVAYGALIPRSAREIPRAGWVNLHFSLLPAWRGAAPVQRALMAGDDVTGASTFLIEEGLDTGPVFGQMTERVRDSDTAGELLARLAEAGAQLLVRTLDGIEDGTLRPRPQPDEEVTVAPKVSVEDARVDWTLPARIVDRRIRGCTPAPGAWSTFRENRIKLGPVRPRAPEPSVELRPGQIRVGRDEVLVGAGSGSVRLGTVRPQGRREIPAVDWARGARPDPGECLR